MASPTGRGFPTRGFKCITSPGLALTSMITPFCASRGLPISSAMRSMPATSSPTVCAAITQLAAISGCMRSVSSTVRSPLW